MLFLNRSFDKKRLKALLLWFRLNLNEGAALKVVEILQELGFRFATQGAISLGLDDLKTPTSKGGRVFQAQLEVALAHHEHHRGNRTPVELFQHLVDTWHRTSQDLTTEVVQLFHSTERINPVYMMAFSGARGNISQVRQLVGMRGLMADPRGQIVGFPILSNFREGLTITEYFVSCYGARKGVVDTAIRTADAGYLTRRLADVSHHVVVRTTNCGTYRSIQLKDIKEGQKTILSLANRLVGRVLAEHISLAPSTTCSTSLHAQRASLVTQRASGKSQAAVVTHASLRDFGASQAGKPNLEGVVGNPSSLVDESQVELMPKNLEKGKLNVCVSHLPSFVEEKAIGEVEVKSTEFVKQLEDSFGYPKRPIGTQITPKKRSSLCIPCPSTYPNPEGVGQQALCFSPEGASKAEGIGAEVASPIPITPKGRAKQRGNACLLGKPEGYAAGSYPRFAKGEAQLRSRGYRNNPVKYDLQLNPLHTEGSSPLNPFGVRACEADGNYGRPIWKAYRNSEITPFLASKLALQCLEISVRSPLSCSLPWGVCQLCYGWGLSEGRRVTLGEAVGIIAAQSIGEPGTQLTLRTFHTGGVFSGELLNEIRAPFIGTVYFPKPLQGLLLRTPHGQIAFLAKVFGKMKIYSLNFKQQLLRNPSKPTASLAPSGAKQRACLPEGYAEVRVQENILEYHLLCIPKIGNPLPRRACEAEGLGGKFRRGLQSRVYSSSTPKVTREKIVFSHKIKTSDTLTISTSLFLHTLLRLPKIAFYILPALFPSKVRKKQVYYHFSSRQLLGLQTITTCTTKGGNIARISNYKTSNIANQKWIQSFEKRIELLVRFFTFSKPSRMFREGGNAKRVCKKAPLYADSLLKCTPPLRYSLPASHTRRASYLRVPEGSGSGAAIPLSKAWGELQPLRGTVCRGYRACYYPFGVRYAEDTVSKVRKSKVGYPTIEYTTLFESCAIEVSYATKTKVWLQNAKKSLQLFSSKYIDFLYINSCFALGGKITKSFSREPIDWLQYSSQVSENIPEARSIEQDSVLSPVTSAYPSGQQARRGTACISNPEGVVASSISPKEISLYPEGASEAGVHFSGGMQINKIKNQKAGSKNKQTREFTIQPSTVLFVRQKEHVYSNQLLAEFSSSTLLPSESKGKTKDQIEMTQQVLSETAGQVWFKEMDYGSRKGPGSGSLGTHFSSQDLGGIWVLAGKPMTNPLTFSDKQLLVVNQSASLLRPLPSFFVKNVLAYPSSYGNQRAQLLEPICFATPRFAKGRAKQGVDPQKETDTINQRHKKESYLPKTPEGASYYPLAKRGVKLQHPTYPEGVRIHFSEDIPTKMNPLLVYPKPLRGKGWRSKQSEGSSPLSKAWACEADGYRKEEGSEPGYVDGSNRILSMHTFRSTRFIDAAKKNCQSCSLYRDTYAAPSSFDVNAGLNIVTMQKTNVYANREFLAYCQLPPLDTFPRRGKRSRGNKPLRGKDALPAVPRSVQPTTHLLRKPLPRRGLGVQGLRSKGIGILPSPSAEFILVKASSASDAFTKMNSNPLAKRGVGMQVSYFRHLTTPSGLGMERKQGGLCIANPEGVVASPIPSASLAPIPLSKAWGELQPLRGKVCRGYRGERSRGYASANKLFKKSIEKKTVFRKQTIPFLYESDQVTFATDYKKQFSITNFSPSIAISTKNRYAEKEITLFNVFPGQFLAYGDNIINKIVTTESGQVLYINSQKITLRKAQTVLIYSQAIVAVFSEEWIKKGTPLMSLSYQKLVTGDIVQGLPKIEQLFEARMLKDGTFWSGSLQAQLNQFFQEYKEGKNGLFPMPLAEAVRKGFSEIQRVLVEGVQRVYISQGVLIADKHLEVIVRQMTCKGRILYSGDTGFLRNELVSLDKIENVNQVIYGQKALYHPQVRGITDASLESESFLSAASFQETTRVLSRDAIIGKTDLMRGLKERVIVGELIQAGTGLANNSVYSLI